MNDFEKLNEIAKGNGGIKMFPLPGNLISANTGKENWGRVTVAVDNASIGDVLKDDVIGVLYLIKKDEWEKVNK